MRSGTNLINVLQGDGTGNFSNYATAPTPGMPVGVVVKDLSGDGKPDVAATSSTVVNGIGQPFVTVLINNGASGFNPAVDYQTHGAGPIATGDFNGDSKPDLAMASGAVFVGSSLDGIAVLTNKGDGQFNTAVGYSAGSQSSHLAVADFNNDNKDDVVITQFGGESVSVLLNNGAAALPCLSVNDVTITENDTGTVDAIFTVTLSAPSAQIVKVNHFAIPSTSSASVATRGVDFEDVPGTLSFAPGETTKTFSVPIKGDLIDEFDQLFLVALTTPVNAAIGDGKGVGTILDNDGPPGLSVNDLTVAEGTQVQATATFTVSINRASEKPISVQFSHQAGTATAAVDFLGVTLGTIEFEPGTVSKTILNNIVQDNTFEPDETATVRNMT